MNIHILLRYNKATPRATPVEVAYINGFKEAIKAAAIMETRYPRYGFVSGPLAFYKTAEDFLNSSASDMD